MRCDRTNADGTRCEAHCQRGKPYCAPHNPEMPEIRRKAREDRLMTVDALDRKIAEHKAEITRLRHLRAIAKRVSR